MTIVRVVYLSCDVCNVATCEAGCPHDSGIEAREFHEWTRRGKRDLCPDCAEPTAQEHVDGSAR